MCCGASMKTGIILGHLKHAINEGAIIRTAEAFGISNVFYVRKPLLTGAQGSENHMLFHKFDDYNVMLNYLYNNYFNVVCIENNFDAIPLYKMKYPINPVFISGNENTGIPKEINGFAADFVKIEQAPTYMKCLNTSVAMGIVLNDFYTKMRFKYEVI